MSITFNCEHCGRKIEAPDSTGGKWGKCPACHNKVYVPKAEQEEELRLAPLDAEEEKARRSFLAEEVRLREDILSETEVPEEQPAAGQKDEPPQAGTTLSDSELMEAILTYLRAMADGELEQAEQTAAYIMPCGKRAVAILDRVALSELPQPEIADIPPQVLAGLIKKLRARIGR